MSLLLLIGMFLFWMKFKAVFTLCAVSPNHADAAVLGGVEAVFWKIGDTKMIFGEIESARIY
jgi:hypothetical protein